MGIGHVGSASIGMPNRGDEHPASQGRPDPGRESCLGPMERDRQVRPHHRVGCRSRRQVDCRRRIDRDDRDGRLAGPPDQRDGAPDGLPKLAMDAGPEERIDDDRGALDALPDDRDVAGHGRVDASHAWHRVEAIPVPEGRPGSSVGAHWRRGRRRPSSLAGRAAGPPRTRLRRCCRDRTGRGSVRPHHARSPR